MVNITRGIQRKPVKCVLYGVEGIGKSTFASCAPGAVFIDTEDSTAWMDVARTDKPSSWQMLLDQVVFFKTPAARDVCATLVIDTADWAEQMCIDTVCDRSQKKGIEDFGYGKGYVYLQEEFAKLLTALDDVIANGINVLVTAHAKIRKFEQPDEMGAYDRWELKLSKQVAPMLKEWADMVLFCNYKTVVVATDDKGQKHKAGGGKRVMYTSHHPCWDAKNRFGLPDELPLDFSEVAHCFTAHAAPAKPAQIVPTPVLVTAPAPEQSPEQPTEPARQEQTCRMPTMQEEATVQAWEQLADLLTADQISVDELQDCVASHGYYPADMPLGRYDPAFITGCLIANWPQIRAEIKNTPFK